MTNEAETITLIDEEGQSHEFTIWQVIEVSESRYALLVPAGEEEEEDDEDTAYVFRIEQDDQGEDVLHVVDQDDELQKVAQALENLDDEDAEEPPAN